MKKTKTFNQLTLFNVALFFLELMSVENLFLKASQMVLGDQTPLAVAGEILLAVSMLVLVLETLLVFQVDGNNDKPFLTPLLLTHLPWFLGWALPAAASLNLPDPHNFLVRKVQILLGVIWTTHLFAFAAWLLWRARKNKMAVSFTFAWIAVFFFAGSALWTTQCDLSGDEPHYLLMAYSLIHDGDLDLANNYANRDYEKFYQRGTLEPQGLEHVVEGKRYSHHPLGPVLLVLPGFFLLGRLGAALTMALLAALALYWTLRVLELTGAKGWPLQAVGAIGLFSSPLLLFSGLIFPEIPTACLAAGSLYLFLKKRWGWFGLALGVMVWMHNRNVLLVLPLAAFALYEIWKTKKVRLKEGAKLAAGFGFPILLLAVYFHSLYGVLTPLGAHNESFTSLFRLHHFWIGFLGLLMDQECGLWFHFPIFAMTVTGGILLWNSRHPLRHLLVGTVLFFYLFMSFYENLGLTPATRYMVGITPLLLMMLYPALERMKRFYFWESLAVVSVGLGVLADWILAAVPWMRYNKLEGENWVLKIAGNLLHLPLTSWEPSFQSFEISVQTYVLSAFWIVVTVGLTFLFLESSPRQSRKGAGR